MKKFALKLYKKQLKRAVRIGALSQKKADRMYKNAVGFGWAEIIAILLPILLELIEKFLDKYRNDDEDDASVEKRLAKQVASKK
jgi:hypothetical protein